jgi:hypothetical protein
VTDRVPSDHDAVGSHRTRVAEVGRTGRPRVLLPEAVDAAVDDVVRLSLAGDTYHTQINRSLDGERDLRGAFANARLARTDGEGNDALRPWLDAVGVSVGDPLLVDVVTARHEYGLRRPGQRVVYEPSDPPSSSLADIARDIDGR